MATALRLRRGTTSQHSTFTGLEGEVTVDTTKDTVVVHDGSTAGGFPLAKETGSTVAVAAGAVGTPGLTVSGDTNTGIFFPAADTIAFAEGGVESMRIDSDGDVGIGTTTPNTKLQVFSADTKTAGWFQVVDTTTTLGNSFASIHRNASDGDGKYSLLGLQAQNSNGNDQRAFVGIQAVTGVSNYNPNMIFGTTTGSGTYSERMRIDSSGNVGIGESSTAGSAGYTNLVLRGANGSEINLKQGATSYGYMYANSTGFRLDGSGASGTLQFQTNSVERMRIDSSGNVGINSTSPSTYGDAGSAGGRNVVIQSTGTGRGVLVFVSECTGGADEPFGVINFIDSGSTNTNYRGASISGLRGSDDNSAYLRFNTANSGNGAERARITSGGYLKVSDNGTYADSAGTYHEMRQSANTTNFFVQSTNASYTGSVLSSRATRSANSGYYFLVASSGAGADDEFLLRGDGNAYADGTWNNNGADYAEFFESANGQALTLGATVVLDGNKVREATEQDPASAIIGVVRPKEPSKASMVVGNTAWNKWANKYLTDDFDRYIMEDHDVVEWEEQVLEKEALAAVEAVVDEEGNEVSPAVPAQEAVYKTKQHSYESHNIPEGITVSADAVRKTHDEKGNKFQHYKLNPAWNKNAEYTPREQRPEWNIIGLVGQVKVLKGQPTNDRWVKMRDVSATVEEWFIR
jgi:hypothetical protein